MLNLRVTITREARDAQGRLLYRRRQRAHSYVLQFLQHLWAQFAQSSLAGVLDTGGVSRTIEIPANSLSSWDSVDPESSTAAGIVVGTGNTAVTITDTALATLIADGAGAGQLSYGGQTVSAIGGSGSSRTFTITRTFTNNSGGTIVVAEAGLYVRTMEIGSAIRTFMIARDVLGSSDSVGDGVPYTVTYSVTLAVE